MSLDVRGMYRRFKYQGKPPVRLDEHTIESFMAASEKRPQQMTIDLLQAKLKRKNPVRWNRLQSDMRWMRRQMVRMGRNPDDARWLL